MNHTVARRNPFHCWTHSHPNASKKCNGGRFRWLVDNLWLLYQTTRTTWVKWRCGHSLPYTIVIITNSFIIIIIIIIATIIMTTVDARPSDECAASSSTSLTSSDAVNRAPSSASSIHLQNPHPQWPRLISQPSVRAAQRAPFKQP